MGGVISGISNSQAYDAKMGAASANARMAYRAAGDARDLGISNASEMAGRGGLIKAAGTAAAANGGVDVGYGAPAAVRAGTAMMTALDVAKIRNNAARAAFGYEKQGDNYRAEVAADKASSNMAMIGAAGSAITSVVGMAAAGGAFDTAPAVDPTATAAAYESFPSVGAGQAGGMDPFFPSEMER